ncbi:MAG TPA: ERF family protein [Candidatus Saccharimonadales bacterium]|nr:ERF family protein [Candidatus Saccharimonadales bacterium]
MNNLNDLMSAEIDQLATALAKAQGEMAVAGKNQKNPFFKSTYADFEAIIHASRPALSKYGLSVVQPPFISENAPTNSDSIGQMSNSYLVTILMHSSGQWIKSIARHNPPKNDIQSLSSYNTYLKRMCYTSLIGVATGDDDDGEAAVSFTRSNNF